MNRRKPHPQLTHNLALIGGRGCGKSSVAKRLLRTNQNFMLFSLDNLIRYESQACSMPEIVASAGWSGFRELEYQVVERVSAFSSGALIDCGGGVVVDLDTNGDEIYSERKVAALQRNSLIVYLQRDPDYLFSRTEKDANRPLLSEQESFLEIMERRDPWYRKAAHWVVESDARDKKEMSEEILEWFLARASR